MGITYAELYDPEVLTKMIGADYQNEVNLFNSGLIRKEAAPQEGSFIQWIKQTIFSGDEDGQTVGVGSEITLQNKVQTDYAAPLVWRADGAELDDVSEAIMAKLKAEGAEATMANAISAKAAQMVDTVGIKILDGVSRFLITDTNNYNNANGSQVNLVDLEQTKSTRGEKGQNFMGGFMVMRGVMSHQMAALGLVAATSNTMGNMVQNEIVTTGVTGTVLGMNILSTDKIALESSGGVDHIIHLVERGALRMMMADTLKIDPVFRKERAFADSIKFMVSMAGMVDGMSWGSAKANPASITNTALQTGTNYEQAATNIKNVPMARTKGIECLQKSFTYTDTTSFEIGWLPPNAYITDIKVIITTDFTDGVLDVGDASTAAKYVNDLSLNGTGPQTVTAVGTTWGAVESTANQTQINGIVVATGTGLAAGAAKVIVEYAFNE
jgi:hypothetical protein